MAVTDPDCPFHMLYRMGTTIVGSTERLPVPAFYDPLYDVAIVSPDYELEDYQEAADWILSAACERERV